MIYDKLPLLAFPRSPFGSGVAAVITQLANTIIRAIEQDSKVRETEEMEERIAALETRSDGEAGGEAERAREKLSKVDRARE